MKPPQDKLQTDWGAEIVGYHNHFIKYECSGLKTRNRLLGAGHEKGWCPLAIFSRVFGKDVFILFTKLATMCFPKPGFGVHDLTLFGRSV